MRFPFSLVRSMAWYIATQRLRCLLGLGRRRFPLVLMLEPLHRCNLRCRGCGRVREYADTLLQEMTLEECLAAVHECPAPTVSICGGEPLIYGSIVQLVDFILRAGRHIYLCTNGQTLVESVPKFRELARRNRLFFNVHLDGPAPLHDAIVERDGAFDKALAGIRAAKEAGFRVYTNTTVYTATRVDDVIAMGETLREVGIDGMMVAPAFGYEAVIKDATDDFLTRDETHKFFAELTQRIDSRLLTATPGYLDFLAGRRNLRCAAWANPTRNIKGWKSPCYLVTDTHLPSYAALLRETPWERCGVNAASADEANGSDPRCTHCLMHCGFEPAAVLDVGGVAATWRLLRWLL